MKKALLAATLVATLALGACGGKRDVESAEGGDGCTAGSGRMTIATGNSTGVYYVLGGGLAKVIGDNTEISATAAETGASVQNLQQLASGDYDIAFSLADSAADATEGTGSFDSPQELSALTRIYDNYTQVVVRKDSGIKTVADFKGKAISTGSPKSGTEVIAQRLIEAAGLKQEDVKAQRADLTKSVDSLKDGSIDGLVWSGGLPTAGMTDLFTSAGDDVELIDITELLPTMQEVSSVYEEKTIPKDTYKTDADVSTITVPNVLMVRNDMDDATACAVTKLVFDKKSDLEAVHAAAAGIELDLADKTEPIPLQPGAKRAIDELRGQ